MQGHMLWSAIIIGIALVCLIEQILLLQGFFIAVLGPDMICK